MDKKDSRGSLKLPADLHKQIGHYALDHGISNAEAIRRAWDGLTTVTVTPGPRNITIKDGVVSSTEQTAASPQPDILAGLKPDDAQAVREFVEILRGEDEWLRNMAMMAIESSRRLKAPQVQERAVPDVPAAPKAKSRG